MKRLREQASSPDPVTARAASLLAGMRPLDVARIERRPPPSDAKPRPRTMRMGVALILAATLASAVAGAGTLHPARWLRSLAGWGARSSPPTPASPAPRSRVPIAPIAPSVPGTASPAATSPPSAAPVEIPSGAAAAGSSSGARVTTPTAVRIDPRDPRASAATSDTDESALVVDAVRALRRDHDPRRAGNLAQEVLQRYPHGAQLEEATDVAMEAAFADGDTTGARHWAERYLGTFGTGRFADRARQVLAAPPR
jgi:hypothetical protein